MTDTDDGEAIYWVVRHDVEYERAVYREPARLGPDNFCLASSDAGSFWFGIAGPDLTPIEHKGQTSLYFEDENGDWHSPWATATAVRMRSAPRRPSTILHGTCTPVATCRAPLRGPPCRLRSDGEPYCPRGAVQSVC